MALARQIQVTRARPHGLGKVSEVSEEGGEDCCERWFGADEDVGGLVCEMFEGLHGSLRYASLAHLAPSLAKGALLPCSLDASNQQN